MFSFLGSSFYACFAVFLILIGVFGIFPFPLGAAELRLKDIARIEGIRENQITGYGIVVGLPGTGDSKTPFTSESMKNYLKNLGVEANLKPDQTRNIASVLITATIPTYSRKGDKLNVIVSSIGDAKSLEGGVLLQSPLKTAGDKTFAVASGVISFGGRQEQERGSGARGNKKTVGIIHGGAIVEQELNQNFYASERIQIQLENQDFTALNTIVSRIRSILPGKHGIGPESVVPVSPSEIDIVLGKTFENKSDAFLTLLSDIENLTVETQVRPKVIINERTGVIVMGGNITIEEVAVSRSGLNLSVTDKNKRRSWFGKEQEPVKNSFLIEESTSVGDVVEALNKVGASTRDIIAILEALKKSGALHAELEIQ
ncbi:flagellar basal body P-ring protein FlgI [Leptospira borgpetersenii serovar Tarassovi]|nr:flagellar basal body P-ring protein FlgI [Leptospira borgpetersenii serovar Tarassovi]MBE8403275.1 flagellar basal body P-ring protein FlgI [Leptospira borgpetersenii serovar Tarassovi]MBE8405947.1 flagellar basal body P-ring protein FlgI [Leptospira borgpetersenii serovar Tarassovi]MBE8412312.1 flagellar basal body P-ring protein FlgI [Leptospira borgpetersenii serovar Tarassovi]MBE8415332.1 flagellar basal body P-ring protein FlgI [Leptospira borgpetersenii serovar Tarassovi]